MVLKNPTDKFFWIYPNIGFGNAYEKSRYFNDDNYDALLIVRK